MKSATRREYPLMANRPLNGWHLTPFQPLYEQGVRLFHIDVTCSEDIYNPEIRAWIGPNQFDYSPQETYWQKLIASCPEARFCLRLYVGSPPWWDEAHPEELQRYADGRIEHSFQRTERKTLPSLASEVWHRDAIICLQRFLGWLESSGWSEKVWGLFLSYGITWEWGILGSDDFLDYSEPMRKRFRCWLRDVYGNVPALRDAWGSSAVSFESTQIPSPEARLQADGDFRVFPRDRAAYDFQRCLSDTNVDYLLLLVGAARELVGHKYAIGAFYGYTLTAREHSSFMGRYGAGGFQGGHHALARVEASGLLDFIASPFAYVNRNLSDGLLIQHYPLRSIQEHDLQGYDENDLWTFTNPPAFEAKISLGYTPTLEESIAHQRLALGQALCRGTSFWWSELTEWIGRHSPNFSDPAILAELGKQRELFEQLTREGQARSSGQIALVIDERAVDALALSSELFLREIYHQLPPWGWCGAPFDVWLASDVSEKSMRPYRLVYVFAPFLAQSQQDALRSALCNSNRTVWWGPYTGWLTEHGPNARVFEELTCFADPTPSTGTPRQLTRKGWTSLYGSCAGLTARQLARISAQAGVHLLGDAPIQVTASEQLVCVHVARAGRYALRLPAPGVWRELFTGKTVKDGVFDFSDTVVGLFRRDRPDPSRERSHSKEA